MDFRIMGPCPSLLHSSQPFVNNASFASHPIADDVHRRSSSLQQLPEDWGCPTCGAPKKLFALDVKEVSGFAENQGADVVPLKPTPPPVPLTASRKLPDGSRHHPAAARRLWSRNKCHDWRGEKPANLRLSPVLLHVVPFG